MKNVDFEKLENCKWYVVMDDYEGDHEDLEMVDGADTFLNWISVTKKSALSVMDDAPFF